MKDHYLRSLLHPRSIALVGASSREGAVGQEILRNLDEGGYLGSVHLVNPRYKIVGQKHCYASLVEIEEAVDLAIIISPLNTVDSIISQCGAKGIGSAVVMTEGYNVGNHAPAPTIQSLLRQARKHRVRLLGPGSPGIIRSSLNLKIALNRNDLNKGRLALVSHSGAMCNAVLDWAESTGVGFSSIIATGMEVDVGLDEILDYLVTDHHTSGILLYLTRVHNARRFLSALRAASRIKPVVLMKSNYEAGSYCDSVTRTKLTNRMEDVFEAAISRVGVVRAHNFSNLFSAAKILSTSLRSSGERLGIVSNGVGPAMMTSDKLVEYGLQLAALHPSINPVLEKYVSRGTDLRNPMIIGVENAIANYSYSVKTMLECGGADAVLVIHTPDPRVDICEAARAVINAAVLSHKPVLTCWMGDAQVESARTLLLDNGIPTFRTPEAAIDAFRYLCSYWRNQKLLLEVPYPLSKQSPPRISIAQDILDNALLERRRVLNQSDAKSILRSFHIPTTSSFQAHNLQEAISAANQIGFPVVLKIESPHIGYKSEVGGVRLNIRNEQQLRAQYEEMLANIRRVCPMAEITGVAVEQMCVRPHKRELSIRIMNDPVFGAVITLGLGGPLAAVVGERSVAIPPLNSNLVEHLIDNCGVANMLNRFRHLPAIKRDALHMVLMRISEMVCELPQIFEMHVNPLIVDDRGAIVVDVCMVVQRKKCDRGDYSHMAIHPYPAHLCREITLKDGQTIVLRPMRPEDALEEQSFVRQLSTEAKYFRFMHVISEFTPEMLSKMTKLDYDREMAFVAIHEDNAAMEHIVGVSRYSINPDKTSCEFAVTVADAWQGKGLAKALMGSLIGCAREKGLELMTGIVLVNNFSMRRLMENLGFSSRRSEEDPEVLEFEYPLQNEGTETTDQKSLASAGSV